MAAGEFLIGGSLVPADVAKPVVKYIEHVGGAGQYSACDYVATNSVTDLGTVTISGNPTLTDGQRCLAPIAGTYCTILVRSGGAWIVDPNFVVRLNARVNVGSNTWIQTGTVTAVFTHIDAQRRVLAVPESATNISSGFAVLNTAGVWGSSLVVTPTTAGGAVSQSTLLAATPTKCTLAAANGILGTSTAVSIIEDNTTGAHWIGLSLAGIAIGKTVKITFYWKRVGSTAGHSEGLQTYIGSRPAPSYHANTSTAVSALAGTYNEYQVRAFARVDGWQQAEFTCVVPSDFTTLQIYLMQFGGGSSTNYAGDNASGITIDALRAEEIRATTVANISTSALGTITGSSTAPLLEGNLIPGDGWWPDGSKCFRFCGGASRVLALSAAGYGAISGTAQLCTLSFLWAPYDKALVNATVWSFAGSSAALKLEHTTTSKLKLTRTTDAAVTTTLTFDKTIGCVPQACSVVLDGTNAVLYIQGALVEAHAFSLAGATTFTSGSFGGALSARVAEFALHASANSADDILRAHAYVASIRGWRIQPIPLWIYAGQSNAIPTADAMLLSVFGAPGRDRPCVCYENAAIVDEGASAERNYLGWGPARFRSVKNWGEVVAFGSSAFGVHADQLFYSGDLTFIQKMGYVATARIAIQSSSIADQLPGGSSNATLAANVEDLISTIGIPFYLAGFVIVNGESDSSLLAKAQIFDDSLVSFISYVISLGFQTTIDAIKIVIAREHVAEAYAYTGLVRAKQAAFTNSHTNAALYGVDDFPLNVDGMHYNTLTSQITAGQRAAQAALSLTSIVGVPIVE